MRPFRLLSLLAALVLPSAACAQDFRASLLMDSRHLAPLKVEFSAEPPAGTEVRWNFGDGYGALGAKVSHIYYQPGRYTATVSLLQHGGEVGRASLEIEALSQGPERAGLVVLLGPGVAGLSAASGVVYGPLGRIW